MGMAEPVPSEHEQLRACIIRIRQLEDAMRLAGVEVPKWGVSQPTEGDDEEQYGLVEPFIVCASVGGPYEDKAFVAGCWYGKVEAAIKTIGQMHYKRFTVPSPLVPQLDLLAMRHGLTFASEPWEDHPDEWTYVTFSRGARPTEGDDEWLCPECGNLLAADGFHAEEVDECDVIRVMPRPTEGDDE